MLKNWIGQRVLVTGGTGFLGQRLTQRLAEMDAQVTVALCDEDGADRIAALPPATEHRDSDVCNYVQMRRLIETVAPNVVFHLAAVGVNDPFIAEEMALRVNLHGTLNLLRAAQRAKGGRPQRIVVAGTSYEYGTDGGLDPGNVYAASKVAAWAFCRMYHRAHGMPVVVARPFNVYGPGQNKEALIPSAIRAALDGRNFPMTPGEQRRDFIHVDDVISGFLSAAMADGVEGESLDLGTGQSTPVGEIVERIFDLTQSFGQPLIGALPYRPGVIWEQVADADRTAQLTGWRAKIELDTGLQTTIRAITERESLVHIA